MIDGILEQLLIDVLNMSLTASVIILAVLLIRLFLRRAPRIFSYALWAAVLFRLLCPVSFTLAMSLLGALQNETAEQGRMEYIPEDIGYQVAPEVKLPVPGISDTVNNSLPAGNPIGSVNPMQIILYIGARVWILGMLAMVVYSIVSVVRLKKRLKTAEKEDTQIYRFRGRGTPFVYGIFRPRIYLPEGLEEEEEQYILLHEQIHIRRKDPLLRLLGYLALCLHWFNPLVWAAFVYSGRDMEMSCDEAVIRQTGNGMKKEYSASLLALATGGHGVKGIPIAFGEGDTKSRIKNVLRYKKPAKILVGAAAAVCVVFGIFLTANPGKKEPEKETAYYGVITLVEAEEQEGVYQTVVRIPGLGDMQIPEAENVSYYIESESVNSGGLLYQGDLVKITFPAGEEVGIQETWPGSFSIPAETIGVYGEGFEIEQAEQGLWRMTVPIGMAKNAREGDTLEIYHSAPAAEGQAGGQEKELLTSVSVLSVDAENYHIWVELTTDEAKAFFAEFGSGISCEAVQQEGGEPRPEEQENMELTPEQLRDGSVPDGTYCIYLRGISRSARGIDRYVVNFWDGEQDGELPFLAFSDSCKFLVNQNMINTLGYQEISFEEFAELIEDGSDYQNPACEMTFENGVIIEAKLKSEWYAYGITYEEFVRDTWYKDIQTATGLTGEEALAEYYTLVDTIEADIGDGDGIETIEIYTGNIGDGDSGLLLFKAADGTLLYSEGAHASRAGWNNIYLGEEAGVSFLMRVCMEDRDTYGQYSFCTFRLGANGEVFQFQGSSFTFDDGRIPYDDELFKNWMQYFMHSFETSVLLLSTQDGEIRTEHVSEADKYNYETLRRDK